MDAAKNPIQPPFPIPNGYLYIYMVKSIEQLKQAVAEDRKRQEEIKNRPNWRGLYVRKPEENEKRKATQQRRVAEGLNNFGVKATCIYCGFTSQKLKIDKYHNENCPVEKERRETTWLYVSPKLRGLKVKT